MQGGGVNHQQLNAGAQYHQPGRHHTQLTRQVGTAARDQHAVAVDDPAAHQQDAVTMQGGAAATIDFQQGHENQCQWKVFNGVAVGADGPAYVLVATVTQ